MFRIISSFFPGISYFRFSILKRKCAFETWSNDGIPILIGISNPPLFINYAVHAIHYIIIAIVKMESGIPFAMPFIIISLIKFYRKRHAPIDWLKIKCGRLKSREA